MRFSCFKGANVLNRITKASTRTGLDGAFTISAAEGDTIIISAGGYRADTIVVSFSLLLTRFDCTLYRDIISLKEVRVSSNYSADSLSRSNYYRDIYNQPGITGRNRPANGFGITLSPASFFPKNRNKQEVCGSDSKKKRKNDTSIIRFHCHG